MNPKIIFFIFFLYFASLYSTLCYGQSLSSRTWNLSPTMTATLEDGILTVSTSKDSEEMPNVNPWFDFRVNIFTVIIEDKVTSIGGGAFRECTNLTFATIPNSVASIGEIAFRGCSRLIYIPIPNSVTTIGQGAFADCYALTSIEIPKSVTTIEQNTFQRCSGLTSIEIPNSVTTIGWWAFEWCTSLTSIEIPQSVTSIGDFAFATHVEIQNLKDITVGWDRPLPVPDNVFGLSRFFPHTTLHVPVGTKSLYQTANVWRNFGTIVEYNPTDNERIVTQTLKAYSSNGFLYIVDIQSNKPLRVYNISGQLVYKGIAKSKSERIPINTNGIYIVVAENQAVKVIVE